MKMKAHPYWYRDSAAAVAARKVRITGQSRGGIGKPERTFGGVSKMA